MAPLQLVSGTGLIAISEITATVSSSLPLLLLLTPSPSLRPGTIRKNENGAQSMYSYMMKLRDPIFPKCRLFKLIHIRTMCDTCIRKHKETCPHMQIAPVSWKDPENAARVKVSPRAAQTALCTL